MDHGRVGELTVQIVFNAPMIVHDVHDVFHAPFLECGGQLGHGLVATITGVYFVMVRDGIAVVAVAFHIIF